VEENVRTSDSTCCSRDENDFVIEYSAGIPEGLAGIPEGTGPGSSGSIGTGSSDSIGVCTDIGTTKFKDDSSDENMRRMILRMFEVKEADIRTFSPLSLAFLGDAVYSVIIRTMIVSRGSRQPEKLHNETTRYVSAARQAAIGRAIADLLTEEEAKIYKRGRNASPYHHAKHASLKDYLEATALETLCGYMYLQDRMDRFMMLLQAGIERTTGQ